MGSSYELSDAPRVQIVILAGGQGSRLWPVSKMSEPKQFLPLYEGGPSLLRATADRVQSLSQGHPPLILTNHLFADRVRQEVPNAIVLAEPKRRDTAAALGFAAVFSQVIDPDAVLVVCPADHSIADEKIFLNLLMTAIRRAASFPELLTLGITPNSPHTGYGYIKLGDAVSDSCYQVAQFSEKPTECDAMSYLSCGGYLWNSGIYVWRPEVLLEAMSKYLPDLSAKLEVLASEVMLDNVQEVMDAKFGSLPSYPIDKGVVEKVDNCSVVVGPPFGWIDVGSWSSWAQCQEADSSDNVLSGHVYVKGTTNSMIKASGRFVAAIGVKDLFVIETPEAVLICHKDKDQEVKAVTQWLLEEGRSDML